MSSEILSVSEKTRRQFLQQKILFLSIWAACCFIPFFARGNITTVAGMYELKYIVYNVYFSTD